METKKEQSNSKSKQGIKNMQNGAVSFSGGIIGGMTGSAINQQEEMEERVESAPSEQDESTTTVELETAATDSIPTVEIIEEIEPTNNDSIDIIIAEEIEPQPITELNSANEIESLIEENLGGELIAENTETNLATDTTEHASGSIINDATEETANENLNTGYETPENINDNNHNINTDVSELFVDPTEIAENIVTADEIDPNDIDLADNVDIQSIGTVYTITGNTYLAAAFQDVNGNDFLMVDIDGDSVFDRITDMNLQYDFGGVPGGLAVTDAEAMIQEDPTYLAQNEQDESSDFMDEMLEDLVDPTV